MELRTSSPAASTQLDAPGPAAVSGPAAQAAPETTAQAAPAVDPYAAPFQDGGLADLDSLAIAARQRVLDMVAIATASVNDRALAGTLGVRELECIDGEYPYLAWFCGDDGNGSAVPAGRFVVVAFDHLPDDACARAIAGAGPAARACRPSFAELVDDAGETTRYRVRLVDGRSLETLAFADDPDDLEIDAAGDNAALAVCRIEFDLDAGAAPALGDDLACEARLQRLLADS